MYDINLVCPLSKKLLHSGKFNQKRTLVHCPKPWQILKYDPLPSVVGERYVDLKLWFYERESYADSGLWLGSITVLHWVYFIRNTLTKVILLSIAITHTIAVFCWNMQQPIIKKIKSKKKTIWHFVFRNTVSWN